MLMLDFSPCVEESDCLRAGLREDGARGDAHASAALKRRIVPADLSGQPFVLLSRFGDASRDRRILSDRKNRADDRLDTERKKLRITVNGQDRYRHRIVPYQAIAREVRAGNSSARA